MQGQRADTKRWRDEWDRDAYCEIHKEAITSLFLRKKKRNYDYVRHCLSNIGEGQVPQNDLRVPAFYAVLPNASQRTLLCVLFRFRSSFSGHKLLSSHKE